MQSASIREITLQYDSIGSKLHLFFKRLEHSELIKQIHAIILSPITPDFINQHIFRDIDYDPTFVLGYFNETSEIIGIVMGVQRLWKKSAEESWIKFIIVDPRYQRMQIGSKLLIEVEKRLRSNGAKHITFGSSAPSYFLPGLPKTFEGPLSIMKKMGWTLSSTRTNMIYEKTLGFEQFVLDRNDIRLVVGEDLEFNQEKILDFISREFSPSWAKEVEPALLNTLLITGKIKNTFIILEDVSNNKILGFCAIGGTNPFWLGPMGVSKAFRRKGLGKVLVCGAIKDFLTKNPTQNHILIPWVNEANQEFYQKTIGAKIYTPFWKLDKEI